MKSLTKSVLALMATAGLANAATTLITTDPNTYTDAGTAEGNWHYQSLTLNDPGFTLTGAPLDPTMFLDSVTFVHDEGGVTTNPIYMVVMTNITDLSSIVAQSTNTISQGSVAGGELMTWNFSNAIVDTSTEYFFAWYSDTTGDGIIGAGDTAEQARIAMLGNPIAGGTRSQPTGGISGTADAMMDIKLSPVPEPSAAALLGLGGLALILRRRK